MTNLEVVHLNPKAVLSNDCTYTASLCYAMALNNNLPCSIQIGIYPYFGDDIFGANLGGNQKVCLFHQCSLQTAINLSEKSWSCRNVSVKQSIVNFSWEQSLHTETGNNFFQCFHILHMLCYLCPRKTTRFHHPSSFFSISSIVRMPVYPKAKGMEKCVQGVNVDFDLVWLTTYCQTLHKEESVNSDGR